MATDVADAIPGFFSLGTDTGAVTDGMLVGAVEAAVDATGTEAAGATIDAAVEAAVEAADCTAATEDAIADCTAATEDAIADSMAGAADATGAGTDVVDAIPGRFSFGTGTSTAEGAAEGTAAAGAAANDEGTAAAAAFDFTIPGFATPGFFFGRLARISSRSFMSA